MRSPILLPAAGGDTQMELLPVACRSPTMKDAKVRLVEATIELAKAKDVARQKKKRVKKLKGNSLETKNARREAAPLAATLLVTRKLFDMRPKPDPKQGRGAWWARVGNRAARAQDTSWSAASKGIEAT